MRTGTFATRAFRVRQTSALSARTSRGRRSLLRLNPILLALVASSAAWATDEPVRSIDRPSWAVESEPTPDLGFEAPPPAYPLVPVDQSPTWGLRHGLVNTSKRNVAFRVTDLKLSARLPIEISRVYDSASSEAPKAVSLEHAVARTTQNFGPGWILAYSDCLLPTTDGVVMLTSDGDRINWLVQLDGSYRRENDAPTIHSTLQRISEEEFVETRSDGTIWNYGEIHGDFMATQVADRSGNAITIHYQDQLMQSVSESGRTITIVRPTFDPNWPTVSFPTNRIVAINDSTGRQIHFDYDSSGRMISATDAMGEEWTYGYDSASHLASATSPLQQQYFAASYASNGRVIQATTDGGSSHFDGSAPTNATRVEDALGHSWIYTRAAGSGLTTSVEEPSGGIHNFTYDSAGNVTRHDGPAGELERWTFGENHRVLTHRTIGSTGPVTTYHYDSQGADIMSVDGLSGGTTTLQRDGAGRVTLEEDPAGASWVSTYNSNGDRTTFQLPNSVASGSIDPGAKWFYDYDAFGHATTVTDPLGRQFEMEFTNRGELRKLGRPCSDPFNPESAVTGGGVEISGVVSAPFQGELRSCEWTYDRDLLGRVVLTADPEGRTWQQVYDDAGRLVRRNGQSGTHLRYDYDAYSRLVGIVREVDGSTGPTTSFSYDAAGRLATKTTPSGAVWHYQYDESSRLVGTSDPMGRTWSYARDVSGRIVRTTYPGGRQVLLTRDSAGRLTRREFPGGRVETFGYDAPGRLTLAKAVEPSSSLHPEDGSNWQGKILWEYDNLGRPTRQMTDVRNGETTASRDLSYSYDLDGNRIRLQDPAGDGTTDYAYDALDRLTRAASPTARWDVIYDQHSGNRLRVTAGANHEDWSYDLAGKVTGRTWSRDGGEGEGEEVAALGYAFDEEGRVVTETDVALDQTRSLVHAPTGLVSSETLTLPGNDPKTIAYEYDADGQLLSRSTDGPSTDNVSFEWDGAGRLTAAHRANLTRRYLWLDSPTSDPTVASLAYRTLDQVANEPALEIGVDYAGRLARVQSFDANENRTLEARYRWAALESDFVLERNDLGDNGVYIQRRLALDRGSYYTDLSNIGELQRHSNVVESEAVPPSSGDSTSRRGK